MRVTPKLPPIVKKPVRISDDCYEIWYSKPECLGRVHKRGKAWFTEDGLRFMSSLDAMEYLILSQDVRKIATGLRPLPEETKSRIQEEVLKKSKIPTIVPPPSPPAPTRKIVRKGASSGKTVMPVVVDSIPEPRPAPVSRTSTQEHNNPLFRKFLELVESARRETDQQKPNGGPTQEK